MKNIYEGDISKLKLELKLQGIYGRDVVTSRDTGYSRIYSVNNKEVAYWREGSGLILDVVV